MTREYTPRPEAYDGYHIDAQTGEPYQLVRPLRHVHGDIDTLRSAMTDIHRTGLHGERYGELLCILERLWDDVMAAQFSEAEK